EAAAVAMTAGSHGSTYGGNPLACAVGCAVMDEVTAPGFLETVNTRASQLQQKLGGLVEAYPEVFAELRGSGLMLGLKCVAPNTDVLQACYDAGLITVPAGDNVIRLLPPLTLSEDEVTEAVSRLDHAARAIKDRL
ncbi:MAG: acetylornithine transaminase, partial [Roseovarius sp.]|nr:acetylornithine transaminase [Roseovarius sp.]